MDTLPSIEGGTAAAEENGLSIGERVRSIIKNLYNSYINKNLAIKA